MQWETILFRAEVCFFKKLGNKGKGIISIRSNFDIKCCFDVIKSFLKITTDSIKNFNLNKKFWSSDKS